jgi:hypothetical protein
MPISEFHNTIVLFVLFSSTRSSLILPDKIFESCLNRGPEDGEYFLVQGERIQLMYTWHETFRGIFVVFHNHLKILNRLYSINLSQTSLYGFYKVIVQFNITLGHKLAEFHVVTSWDGYFLDSIQLSNVKKIQIWLCKNKKNNDFFDPLLFFLDLKY